MHLESEEKSRSSNHIYKKTNIIVTIHKNKIKKDEKMKIFIAGSTNPNMKKKYTEGVDVIAKHLATKKHSLVMVASPAGSIGAMYTAFRKNNGKIIGYSPLCYEEEGRGMKFDEFSMVDNIYELQKFFLKSSEMTLVLPGGNGTLAELFMFTDLIKSKFTENPVVIYNVNGFFDPIKNYLDFLMKEGVLEQFQKDYFNFCESPDAIIKTIDKIAKSKK